MRFQPEVIRGHLASHTGKENSLSNGHPRNDVTVITQVSCITNDLSLILSVGWMTWDQREILQLKTHGRGCAVTSDKFESTGHNYKEIPSTV